MSIREAALDPLFDPEVIQEPHEYYRYLREKEPVHEVVDGTFLVSRMDLVHEVVTHPETYSSRSGVFLHKGDWETPALRGASSDSMGSEYGSGSIGSLDPPDNDRIRRVVTRKLSMSTMQAMEPEFRDLVVGALSDIAADGRLEWMSQVAIPLPMVMVARILGLDDSLVPDLLTMGYAGIERIGGCFPESRLAELEDATLKGITPVLQAYAEARQGSDAYADGLIGLAARAVHDGEMSDAEALGMVGVLIAAGAESTTSLTGTAVRILAERVDLQEQLRADESLLPNFVEEALRIDPPFRNHYRVVTHDTELAGVRLPQGSHVALMWAAANRDDAEYENPDEVRLDRPKPRYHVGFGWGVHLCVGAPLARVEAKVALETLLARTRNFRIDEDQLPLRYCPSLMIRRLESLPLVLDLKAGGD